jgi:excisionase family DNA binding protein
MPDGFLTVRQVAERLHVADNTVRNLINSGRLRAYRFSGAIRVGEADLDAFIESSEVDW